MILDRGPKIARRREESALFLMKQGNTAKREGIGVFSWYVVCGKGLIP